MAEGLAKSFRDGTVAVEEASFRVEPGECFALLGPNGAGKTTTIHMLLGLLEPTRGRASIAGHDVHADRKEAYRRVGYLSENVLLYGNLSGRENLRFFARVCGHQVPRKRMEDLLDLVGLHEAAARPVLQYSKGMRQRLGLAVALVKDPPALVMDEPTTGLDPGGAESLLALVRSLRDDGRAVLLSTHDLHRVPDVADKVAFMGRRRVQAILTSAQLRGQDLARVYERHTGEAAL